MKLSASDLREIQLFKYYRLVRKWACKTYSLKDADLELLIYLDCKQRFTRQQFIDGTYTSHGINSDGNDYDPKVGSKYGDIATALQLNFLYSKLHLNVRN